MNYATLAFVVSIVIWFALDLMTANPLSRTPLWVLQAMSIAAAATGFSAVVLFILVFYDAR